GPLVRLRAQERREPALRQDDRLAELDPVEADDPADLGADLLGGGGERLPAVVVQRRGPPQLGGRVLPGGALAAALGSRVRRGAADLEDPLAGGEEDLDDRLGAGGVGRGEAVVPGR